MGVITITVPDGYEKVAAKYVKEAVDIQIREDLSKEYRSNVIDDQVEELCVGITAEDELGTDLLAKEDEVDVLV